MTRSNSSGLLLLALSISAGCVAFTGDRSAESRSLTMNIQSTDHSGACRSENDMGRQGDFDKKDRSLEQKRKQRARQLRDGMNESEAVLWEEIRDCALGVNFRPQQPIGRWIVDFYCAQLKLVVEVDGGVHGQERVRAKDVLRDKWFRDAGYTVVRYRAGRVRQSPLAIRTHLLSIVTKIAGAERYGN